MTINHRILQALIPVAILAIAATACSDEQRQALGEGDVRDSLRAATEQTLAEAGTTAADGLDCTSTMRADGTVDSTCAGTTDRGDVITAAYHGTADVDAEKCTAVMTVTIGATELPAQSGVDCFAA